MDLQELERNQLLSDGETERGSDSANGEGKGDGEGKGAVVDDFEEETAGM